MALALTLTLSRLYLLGFLSMSVSALVLKGRMVAPIDSHLHIWSTGEAPYPYTIEPPIDLKACGVEDLLEKQGAAKVGGALIVQPSTLGYDHSYILSKIKSSGGRYKGMCLLNPTLSVAEGLEYLQERKEEGFVGVRFNPYLFPGGEAMSGARGSRLYKRAGELNLPVGFMCFKGLALHFEDIVQLLEASPSTKAVIDHWGFLLQAGSIDDSSWQALLSLARYPQVYIKISALFRVSTLNWPYPDLDARLVELKDTFGANRLMWGSDYPYLLQKGGYLEGLSALSEWPGSSSAFTGSEWDLLFRGTVEAVFGKWEIGEELGEE